MTLYATLDEGKDEMVAEDTVDDGKLLRRLRHVSRRLDREMGARVEVFAPVLETRRILVTSERVNSYDGTLRVGGGLVALSAVTLGDTTLTIGTNVEAFPDSAMPPFPYLRLFGTGQDWFGYCPATNRPLEAVVTGIWVIHRDYANAWWSADTLSANIASSDTTLTVADVDGTDLYGLTPRISAGNLLKIGDEFLEVLATNTGTNAVTVRRGVNGTTAAAHSASDAVYVWQVEDVVRQAVAKQAGLMYARRGAYNTVEVSGMSEIRFPADLLAEVRAVLQEFAYGN